MRNSTKTLITLTAAVAFAMPVMAEEPMMKDKMTHDMRQAGEKTANSNLLGQGVKIREEADKEGITDLVSVITEAALSNDGIENVTERLVDQDRNRFGRFIDNANEQDLTNYNASVEAFKQNWQKKYGQGFGIENESETFASLKITQGEINDPTAFAANWPVAPVGMEGDRAEMARSQLNANEERDENSNIQEGREVAVVTIDCNGKPLNLSMLKEFPGVWKLDVPNNISGEQVARALAFRIDALNENMANWPADANEAQRVVAGELLSAIVTGEGKDMKSKDGKDAMKSKGDHADHADTANDNDGM